MTAAQVEHTETGAPSTSGHGRLMTGRNALVVASGLAMGSGLTWLGTVSPAASAVAGGAAVAVVLVEQVKRGRS